MWKSHKDILACCTAGAEALGRALAAASCILEKLHVNYCNEMGDAAGASSFA